LKSNEWDANRLISRVLEEEVAVMNVICGLVISLLGPAEQGEEPQPPQTGAKVSVTTE